VNSAQIGQKTETWMLRAFLVTGVLSFIALFQLAYLEWLYPYFSYYGFENSNPATQFLMLAWILSAFPSLWMPIRLTRPSQLIYWVLYLTVFIPSMFVPLYMGLVDASTNVSMMLVLFAGFAILGALYLYPLPVFRELALSWGLFWTIFTLIYLGLTLWMVLVFRGNLHIVSFADIYDLRFAASDLAEGTLVNYAITWLTGVVGPFLMAWGLVNRHLLACAAGVFAQLLVYSAIGAKASLLSILIICVFALILSDKGHSFGIKVVWGCAGLFFLLYLAKDADPSSGSIMGWALSIILMRTFGNSGLSMEWYRDFFLRNPLTYYSHVTGINWLVHYPYVNQLGLEVGRFYSGDPMLDQNANFWAMDGLAGGGLLGVLFVSVLVALIFWLLDVAAEKHDLRFTALLVCFTAMNLANISLFTTLLSGGFGFLMPILYIMPTKAASRLP
jgi:hypothetical protein